MAFFYSEDNWPRDKISSLTGKITDEDSKHPDEYFDILSEPESVGCYVHHTDSFTVRVNQLHNYIKYNKAVRALSHIFNAIDYVFVSFSTEIRVYSQI